MEEKYEGKKGAKVINDAVKDVLVQRAGIAAVFNILGAAGISAVPLQFY